MNHRQWKKNYKKKHGCNPPLEVDRRKQAKVVRKVLNNISSLDIEDMCKTILNGLSMGFKTLGVELIKVGNSLEVK